MQPTMTGLGPNTRQLDPTGTRMVGLIFMLIGILIIYFTYGPLFGPNPAANWHTVNGIIISTNITSTFIPSQNHQNQYVYTPNVRYTYTLNGVSYINNQIYPFGNSYQFPTEIAAEDAIQNYTVGKTVTVYYDSAGGNTALTTKNSGFSTLVLVFFVIGVMAILMGVLGLISGSR